MRGYEVKLNGGWYYVCKDGERISQGFATMREADHFIDTAIKESREAEKDLEIAIRVLDKRKNIACDNVNKAEAMMNSTENVGEYRRASQMLPHFIHKRDTLANAITILQTSQDLIPFYNKDGTERKR